MMIYSLKILFFMVFLISCQNRYGNCSVFAMAVSERNVSEVAMEFPHLASQKSAEEEISSDEGTGVINREESAADIDDDKNILEGRGKKKKKIKDVLALLGVALAVKCIMVVKALTVKALFASMLALFLSLLTVLKKLFESKHHEPQTTVVLQKEPQHHFTSHDRSFPEVKQIPDEADWAGYHGIEIGPRPKWQRSKKKKSDRPKYRRQGEKVFLQGGYSEHDQDKRNRRKNLLGSLEDGRRLVDKYDRNRGGKMEKESGIGEVEGGFLSPEMRGFDEGDLEATERGLDDMGSHGVDPSPDLVGHSVGVWGMTGVLEKDKGVEVGAHEVDSRPEVGNVDGHWGSYNLESIWEDIMKSRMNDSTISDINHSLEASRELTSSSSERRDIDVLHRKKPNNKTAKVFFNYVDSNGRSTRVFTNWDEYERFVGGNSTTEILY